MVLLLEERPQALIASFCSSKQPPEVGERRRVRGLLGGRSRHQAQAEARGDRGGTEDAQRGVDHGRFLRGLWLSRRPPSHASSMPLVQVFWPALTSRFEQRARGRSAQGREQGVECPDPVTRC